MKTILNIIKKEFLQFKRDPKMFMIILVAPVIQLIFLGYAANLDVEKIHIAVLDRDNSAISREYIQTLENTGYIFADYNVEKYKDGIELLKSGKVIGVIIIPNNFEKKIKRYETADIQALFDASDGNTTTISAGYIQQATSAFSKKILLDVMSKSGQQLSFGSINSKTRVWYNPELKSYVFMVPAIVGLLLMIITMLLTSLAIVKEKEIGTLEQLVVTPIKPHQLIIGKLIPYTIMGMVAVIIILSAMHYIFLIPIRGNIFFLLFASFIYILSTLGLGLFVSTISKTQQQAMMVAIFIFMLPMIYFSGFAFPIENMPMIIQKFTIVIPLKYFLTIIRGVILKGLGFAELWEEILTLFLMGAAILFLSSKRFSKKLD